MRRARAAAGAALAVAALAAAGPAAAITGGRADGGAHAAVGALVVDVGGGQLAATCSGTLISATAFLTAAHCVSAPGQSVWVSFDPVSSIGGARLAGTAFPNPAYAGGKGADLAVIRLPAPVSGIVPMALPRLDLLSSFGGKNGLRDQPFTVVGYGVTSASTGKGGLTFSATAGRQTATSAYKSLDARSLTLSQKTSQDLGGTCYGDSGGPILLGAPEQLVAVTTSGDKLCKSTGVGQRLDTADARAFLAGFVPLP
jgi:secreted trypsin-like serine protease